MKLRALVIVGLGVGCSSSSPSRTVPPPDRHARARPAPQPQPPLKPTRPEPAGADGVEVLVADQPWAKDLVVTDDELYWIAGGHFEHADLYKAPHRRGATGELLFDSHGAGELIELGDKLVWTEESFSLFTMARHGGTASKLVELQDAAYFLVDHDGLVVGAYLPEEKGDARVFRVSDRGEISNVVELRGMQTPSVAFDATGAMYVATYADGFTPKRTAVGRVVDDKLVPFREPKSARALAADADALYAVVDDGLHSSIVKVTLATNKAAKLVDEQAGGISAIAVDDTYVYWSEYVIGTTDGRIWRLAKAGGTPQAIADVGEASRLVVYGPDLYWADARKNLIARIRR
jgi:hypothetical protein